MINGENIPEEDSKNSYTNKRKIEQMVSEDIATNWIWNSNNDGILLLLSKIDFRSSWSWIGGRYDATNIIKNQMLVL